MNGGERLQRRDQLVLHALVDALPTSPEGDETLKPVRARARNLPTMLRRHGPIQVLLFLHAKGTGGASVDDRKLAVWLMSGLRSFLPIGQQLDPAGYAQSLSGLSLAEYLVHWRSSVEAASWLKRLIEARTQTGSAGRSAPPDEGGGERQGDGR